MSKTRLAIILLAILSLVWGLGWPMISLGLPYCPALWYGALRFMGATILVFLQMGLFVLLFTLGLKYVPPGRSSIIAYLAPLFVTPIAVIFFGEKLTPGKIMGLLLGVAGVFVLFSPWQLNWHDPRLLLGNGLLLLSAVVWSAGMLHIRFAKWHRPSHQLFPWQLLTATIVNVLMAMIFSRHPQINWSHPLMLSMGYAILFNTVVGYLLSIIITRYLSVVTTSLGLLAIPIVSLLSSAWLVGEKLDAGILTAMGLIIAGLACVAVSRE